MGLFEYIIGSVLIVFALIMVAVILLQEGRRKGLSGTIAGGADTFLSKGKARAVDAMLSRWTKFIAIAFFLLIIAANVVAVLLKPAPAAEPTDDDHAAITEIVQD